MAEFNLLTEDQVSSVVETGSRDELVNLINTLRHEIAVLQSAVANLVDERYGSMGNWTEEREVNMLECDLHVSRDMARLILQSCDVTYANRTYDII